MGIGNKIDELNQLKKLTLDAARPHAVEKQKKLGKMTARERLELLSDPESFMEIGQLVIGSNISDKETPADGVITGVGLVDGRPTAVVNYDFTVIGGSQGKKGHEKTDSLHEMVLDQAMPIVYLLDGGGGRAQDMDLSQSDPHGKVTMFYDQVRLSGWVPMVAGILGPAFAGHANLAAVCDLIIMVEETSSMGIAGTHFARRSISFDTTPGELGGARMHAEVSGLADVLVKDDEECILKIKDYLSYFPGNASKMPPMGSCDDPVDRKEAILRDIVPDSEKGAYDMYRIIQAVVDHGRIFDIKPDWAKNIITCLARLNGRSVGIIANQPMCKAGVIDAKGGEKMAHFIEICDAFNIPLIFFTDVPGIMIGPESEREGTVKRGLKPLFALGHKTVPSICVIIRKNYGIAAYIMGARDCGHNMVIGWPTAELGGMGLEGAVEVLHRKQISASKEPDKLREKLINEIRSKIQAINLARAFSLDDVIDPMETRPYLIKALNYLEHKVNHLPPKKHGIHLI